MKASFDEAMAEIRKDIKAYRSMEKELEHDHSGRIAMFHDGKLVSTYSDRGDAYDIGCDGSFCTEADRRETCITRRRQAIRPTDGH